MLSNLTNGFKTVLCAQFASETKLKSENSDLQQLLLLSDIMKIKIFINQKTAVKLNKKHEISAANAATTMNNVLI